MIAILTDFGSKDWFVASIKGTIAQIAPEEPMVDISHEIPSGDVRAGAFVLSQCVDDFPRGTVFLGVVDPGVGSSRAAVMIESNNRLFVGPDNGVFSLVLGDNYTSYRIETNRLPGFLKSSLTFHGRDIFAPAAALLASGSTMSELGEPLEEIEKSPTLFTTVQQLPAVGEVMHIDHFGNAITNLDIELVRDDCFRAIVSGGERIPFFDTFSSVPDGSPVAYIGSGGFLEIGVNRGRAALEFGLNVGDTIQLI